MDGRVSPALCEVVGGAGGEVVVRAAGEIDATTAAVFGRGLDEAIERYDAHVLIDLAGVTFMDSTGLGVLVRARLRLVDERRSMRISRPSHPVVQVLSLAGLTDWIIGDN